MSAMPLLWFAKDSSSVMQDSLKPLLWSCTGWIGQVHDSAVGVGWKAHAQGVQRDTDAHLRCSPQ